MKKYRDLIIYSIFLILILGFGIAKIAPLVSSFFDLHNQVVSKRTEVQDVERQVQQIRQTQAADANAQAQSPDKDIYKPSEAGEDTETSFTVIFDDVINMAKYNGVKIYSIEYAYDPTDDPFVAGAPDKFHACQLTMDLVADYNDLEGFLKEIYKYPYLVNFNSIKIVPYQKNKKLLLVEVALTLYSTK